MAQNGSDTKKQEPNAAAGAVVILVFIVLVIWAGSTILSPKQPSQADVAAPTTTEPAPEAAPEPAKPISLSGTGQAATEKFELKAGLATAKMTHQGSSNFSIFLMNSKGERTELLVNEIGDFDGSKALTIPSDGQYLLDVSASGPWTVEIKQ